jgi:hypothetical protein
MITLDDTTPLNGPRIDVGSRIAWATRMVRLTAPDPVDRRLRSIAAGIGTSAASLSRLETGQVRDGVLVDGYERVLGRPAGSLRAPIDILCRTFPGESPVDARPGETIQSVAQLSRLTERVLAGDPVSGGEWLIWSRALSRPGTIGMIERTFQRATGRLVDELGRAVSHAYPTRYEALSLLRCSQYGDWVLEAARAELAHPHVQGLGDLMSAVGEAVTDDAVEWCLQLVHDPRPAVAAGGALALENMGQVSGGAIWETVAAELVKAYDDSQPGSAAEDWLCHLMRLVPSRVWRDLDLTPSRPFAPAPHIPEWSRDERNAMWQDCVAGAARITAAMDLEDQPMLARLLFDMAYSPYGSRAATSYFLLGAIPGMTTATGRHLTRIVESAADPGVRSRVLRRLPAVLHGEYVDAAAEWLGSDDPELRSAAVTITGAAGRPLPEGVLASAVADPAVARSALFGAGMAGDPRLADIAGDPSQPADTRARAAWWVERGARVTD